MVRARTVLDERVERELDGDPGIEHDDLAARSQDGEAGVLSQKVLNRRPSGFSHHCPLVLHDRAGPHHYFWNTHRRERRRRRQLGR